MAGVVGDGGDLGPDVFGFKRLGETQPLAGRRTVQRLPQVLDLLHVGVIFVEIDRPSLLHPTFGDGPNPLVIHVPANSQGRVDSDGGEIVP